ncbi:ATP-dependent DNA ligase [Paraburkholderia terrae]|uniref:ATP-dependent DNA ligase n=1 Tax=Paraburkholderia terrae TaxID=311230 RepID=UPI00296ABF55|nr:hypothetical protein [Paraburkholderia terrae]MDW3655166.1 hypothetical protein [Paraburkholderia terrae]
MTTPRASMCSTCLPCDKRDIRNLPLVERKEVLRDDFDDTGTLVFVRGIASAGVWVFQQVRAHDLEGMVAKRLDSIYHRGKSRDWLKIKYPDSMGGPPHSGSATRTRSLR